MRYACFFVLLISVACLATTCCGLQIVTTSTDRAQELIPIACEDLFAVLSDFDKQTNNVDANEMPVAIARSAGMHWINEAIDSAWLPPASASVSFVRDAYDSVDVMRCQWKTNGILIQVAQSAKFFALRITPNEWNVSAIDDDIEMAKQICTDVFICSGSRRTSQGEIVRLPALSKTIADWLFKDGVVFVQSDPEKRYLYGHGMTAEDALAQYGQDENDWLRIDQPDNPKWYESAFAWRYWFKLIHWRIEGGRLEFCFAKFEGDTQSLDGLRSLEREWF